jgi:hypothetical protein
MSDITGAADNRLETPSLQMKIKLPPQDDGDPAEPSRSWAHSSEGPQSTSQPTDQRPAPVATPHPIEDAPALAPPSAAPEPADKNANSPKRRSFRQPATVTFTNRLSVDHRELLQEMADLEGLTIRAILERSLDHYAAAVHPDLGSSAGRL